MHDDVRNDWRRVDPLTAATIEHLRHDCDGCRRLLSLPISQPLQGCRNGPGLFDIVDLLEGAAHLQANGRGGEVPPILFPLMPCPTQHLRPTVVALSAAAPPRQGAWRGGLGLGFSAAQLCSEGVGLFASPLRLRVRPELRSLVGT